MTKKDWRLVFIVAALTTLIGTGGTVLMWNHIYQMFLHNTSRPVDTQN